MKLISQLFKHESTGITFEVEFKDGKKHITVYNNHDEDEFLFKNSKPETLIKVSRALLEIGNFCDIMDLPKTDRKVFFMDDIVDAPPEATDPNSTATFN